MYMYIHTNIHTCYLVLARKEGAAPLQNGVPIEAKVGRAPEEDDQNEDLHDGVDALVHTKQDTTPYTLHPAPCTLHPAPCNLHPTPYTLNAAP